MTGQVFEIRRFAVHDGPGIRTTVFLQGCPLRCVWCHNPEGLTRRTQTAYYAEKCINCGRCAGLCAANRMEDGRHVFRREDCAACGRCVRVCSRDCFRVYGGTYTVEALLELLLEDRDFYENSGGGITLSGGECLTQADFCAELLRLCREKGLHTAVDTCGQVPEEAVRKVLPWTDLFLYDLKAFDPEVHRRITGFTNERILDNLRLIDREGKPFEVRFPYAPELNGSEIRPIADFLRGMKHLTGVKVLPIHNLSGSKYAALGLAPPESPEPPDRQQTEEAERIFTPPRRG